MKHTCKDQKVGNWVSEIFGETYLYRPEGGKLGFGDFW